MIYLVVGIPPLPLTEEEQEEANQSEDAAGRLRNWYFVAEKLGLKICYPDCDGGDLDGEDDDEENKDNKENGDQ